MAPTRLNWGGQLGVVLSRGDNSTVVPYLQNWHSNFFHILKFGGVKFRFKVFLGFSVIFGRGVLPPFQKSKHKFYCLPLTATTGRRMNSNEGNAM